MNSLRLRRPYAHTACDMYIHSRAVLAIRIHRWTTFVYCSPIMIPELGEVNSLRGEMRRAATREPEPGALKAPGLPSPPIHGVAQGLGLFVLGRPQISHCAGQVSVAHHLLDGPNVESRSQELRAVGDRKSTRLNS